MMKQKKRVINFILAFMCCVFVFMGSGIESRAEEHTDSKYIMYEDFKYYANGLNGDISNHRITYWSYYTPDESKMHRVMYSDGNYLYFVFYSFEPVDLYTFYTLYYLNEDGSIKKVNTAKEFNYIDGRYDGTFLLDNGVRVYFYTNSGFTKLQNNDNQICELLLFSDVYENLPISNTEPETALKYILNNGLEPDIPFEDEFIPDFDNYYHEDTDIWINDMRAGVEEDVLYSTWDGLAGTGVFMLEGYENTYIQVHLTFIDDKGTKSIEDDEYSDMFDFYTELPPNEFSIELSNFEVPEGYRLWLMIAVPYWYFNDDVNSTMFKGKQTYMFFDEDGVSDYPLIKDTADIYNPLDPNLSNWNAITNFTGDYFYNMGNVMNQTFNNWDGSGMGADNVKLNNSLSNFSQEEDAIFNSVSDTLNGFEFDNYLSFGDKVTAGVSFGSGLINKFFEVSGDFTILFVVGCVMVFVFIVVGIWRFK